MERQREEKWTSLTESGKRQTLEEKTELIHGP